MAPAVRAGPGSPRVGDAEGGDDAEGSDTTVLDGLSTCIVSPPLPS